MRAAGARYYLAHGDSASAARSIAEDVAVGFAWTWALADLLGEYERDRATYPTMNAFMPRLVTFFENWANRRQR